MIFRYLSTSLAIAVTSGSLAFAQDGDADFPLAPVIDASTHREVSYANLDSQSFDATPAYGDQDGAGWLQSRLDRNGTLSSLGLQLHGYLDQGLAANSDHPTNNSNLPVTFNDRANEYQMNQLYMALEKPVDNCGCHWDIGGRVDVLYGTDYYFTTATGLETRSDGSQRWNSGTGPRGVGAGAAGMYGLALPQAYVEIAAPIAGGINVKLGHFYSPLGYEQVMSPQNFFYSHSYAMQYAEPFTHTGVLAEQQLSDSVNILYGATTGWNAFDSNRDQWGLLAGFKWSNSNTSLAWMVHTGEDGPPGVNNPAFFAGPTNPNNVTVSSLVLQRQLSDRLRYVFQHDFGAEQDGEFSGGTFNAAKWYGINQYLLYDLNECWSFGMRFEWFRDQDHSRVIDLAGSGLPVTGGNYYEVSAGANWSPWDDLIIRPELRWDWSDTESPALGVGGPFDNFTGSDQLTLALDVILRL